jgi:RNA-directed DNA polymerase
MDDFVMCLQYREDAERVSEVLRKHLSKFALVLEPSKTKLIEFGRFAERDARARGQRPATLYFLGFTHYCTRNRKGNFKVGRKTEKSRLRRTLACLQELMREIRHAPVKDQVTALNQVLRGHYAYYGVAGNLPSLHKVHRAVERYWHKMLCSRSWKSYMPWEVFVQVKTCFPLLRPRLFLPYARLKSCAVL